MTPVTGILRVPRRAALIAIAALVSAASLASFAESYRGLYDWAREHGLSGLWAAGWPLQVDVFIAVGELALFVALADAWNRRSRIGAWLVTLAGLAVSVAGNVGHVGGNLASHVTAAVPPLAAAAALAVGLGVLKRVVEAHSQAHPETVSGAVPESSEDAAPGDPQAVPQDDPGPLPEAIPDRAPVAAPSVPETALQDIPRTLPAPSPSAVRKPSPSAVKRMTPGDLAPYVQAVLEDAPETIPADLMKSLHIGREKAREALRLARRERTVVQIGQAGHR
jgi:hypothetical protein